MEQNQKIFLIGFMGCGKTTHAKKLAKALRSSFIDLDNYMEKKEEIIQGMMGKMTTAKIVTSTLLRSFILSVILGAIAALFVRKKEKINDIVL